MGLAAAAVSRGATLTSVRRSRAFVRDERGWRSRRRRGTVTAEAVVVATSAPLQDLRALRRHLKAPDDLRRCDDAITGGCSPQMSDSRTSVLMDTETPPHMLRWLKDDRALFAGADQPAGAGSRCATRRSFNAAAS